jgi:hypothetical protein
MATNLERGTAFELQLRNLFEARGYRAMQDVRMVGRSGAEHQIDVFAEFDLPLQTVRLIVEAKAHESPIDKDVLLKLVQIVDDLGADRGVLATTSHFTPGALKMAEGHNVDLWDRDHVLRLLGESALASLGEVGVPGAASANLSTDTSLRGIVPLVTLEDARAAVEAGVEKRRRGGLLGVGRVEEKLVEIELVHHVFYEATLDAPTFEEERRGLLSKEVVRKIIPVRLSVGAFTGRIVTVDISGRVVGTPYSLPELSSDEVEVIKALPDDWFTRDDLLGLGYTQGKAQRLLASLQAKELLLADRLDGRKFSYQITGQIPVPNNIRTVTSALTANPLDKQPKTIKGALRSQAAIIRSLEALVPEGVVRELSVLYYPYYAYTLQRPDGSRRHELLDGVTGAIRHPDS